MISVKAWAEEGERTSRRNKLRISPAATVVGAKVELDIDVRRSPDRLIREVATRATLSALKKLSQSVSWHVNSDEVEVS